MNRVILLTWVSWSWKTTIQERLLWEWFIRPINFSTREPRSDNELDEYVFITREQFLFKLNKWDFVEYTQYNWNFYWISKNWFNGDSPIIAIVDPLGREAIKEYLSRNGIIPECYFISIDKDTQKERLTLRWDSKDDISRREKDFNWFSPSVNCRILDWNKSVDELIWFILTNNE
jgi:guanylate kinase